MKKTACVSAMALILSSTLAHAGGEIIAQPPAAPPPPPPLPEVFGGVGGAPVEPAVAGLLGPGALALGGLAAAGLICIVADCFDGGGGSTDTTDTTDTTN